MEKHRASILPFKASTSSAYNAEAEKESNVIGQRIDKARRDAGLSMSELSAALRIYGVTMSASGVGKWVQGKALPNVYHLIALCYALKIEDGVSFFTRQYAPALNNEGIRKVQEYREDLVASGRYKPQVNAGITIEYVDMPIGNLAVSAGTGEFLDDCNFQRIPFPKNSVPADADFGLYVSGDSMEPVYHDGQVVWVQKCDTLAVGQVGIFTYDGAGYLKVYNEQKPSENIRDAFTDSYGIIHPQPVMISYNQDYPPKPVQPETEFRIVGRVL